ncbi:MAG: BtpA/SgcQ family protein, partial [Bacillota bacterium]|nr:BtpA/SgcQ family protein [Bacillota bacterium]
MKMKKDIKEIFGTNKPIIGMLHLKGESDSEIISIADKELNILLENKVDGVLVENYFGSPNQAELVLKYVSETYPDICYGINLLHDDDMAFELAQKYHAKFIQLDSVSGHLSLEDDKKFGEFISEVRRKCDSFILGGVRFKYQPYKSGRRLEEDLIIGMDRCDAIVVTGDATGHETDLSKIRNFREIIGGFPLFIGAGMTPENAVKQMGIADGAIVGSYFKDTYKDTGNVSGSHVKRFMDEIIMVRESSLERVENIIKPIEEYCTYKEELFKEKNLREFCLENEITGMEVFMDDIISRDMLLFKNEQEKQKLEEKLKYLNVKRIHCAYWAYPTSFLTKNRFSELIERFGGADEVKKYYGDFTGKHMYERWVQEYEIASSLNAQAYTFHLIDYAPIDGKWSFTIPREDIRQAMIYMIQQLLNCLLERNLLSENSPYIEVENAGWGLEYGLQSAEDFEEMFCQIYDPFDRVRIGWDINHLLHAVGFSEKEQRAEFFLTSEEITKEMKEMENKYGYIQSLFAEKWLKKNILNRSIINKITSIHLSDCKMKTTAYFKNGILIGKYNEVIQSME